MSHHNQSLLFSSSRATEFLFHGEAIRVVSRRLMACAAVFLATSGAALLVTASSVMASEETDPPLLSLQQFCGMDRATVTRRELIRVRGTVTYVNPEWRAAFIQDGDRAIKIFLKSDADLKVGELVELTGHPAFGDESIVFSLAESEVIGAGKMPEPVRIDGSRPFSMDLLNRWSELEGPIYRSVTGETYSFIHVASDKFGVFVISPRAAELPNADELRRSRIRARGVLMLSAAGPHPFRVVLAVPADSLIETIPDESSDGGVRVRSICEIHRRDMQGEAEASARFRAVVRCVFPPDRLFLSDETGSLYVELSDPKFAQQIAIGDVVEVEGGIDRRLKHPYLRDAQARYLGKGFSTTPAVVSPIDGRGHFGESIQLKGMLVAKDSEKNWMLLRDGGSYFRCWYQEHDATTVHQAGIGSRISVSGGCWGSPSDDASFDIFASAVNVLFQIPEAEEHSVSDRSLAAIGAEPMTEPVQPVSAQTIDSSLVRSALFALLLLFLATLIWLVYRRLKEQQRFQKSIHEQLNNLSHIARLNTLAEMVGALAHELNQPLASVSNYAATAEILSRKKAVDSEKMADVLTKIGREAYRAGEIIRRLRHLVRKKTPGLMPVQLSEIIYETVELYRTQHVTASGLVQVDVPESLPLVMADSVQIQQVVLNLLLNAKDATEAQPDIIPLIRIETLLDSGMLVVSVADNGIGISNPNAEAIFEPYFTTREKGTGLGLAISRTIIETHGGKIAAEKLSPHGTRITFSLPLSNSRMLVSG